jgi:hypothetical protein
MSRTDDLPRLSSAQADVPEELRALLQSASSDGPSAAQIARLSERLQGLTSTTASPAGWSGPSAATASWKLLALVVAGTGIVVGVGAGLAGRAHRAEPARRVSPALAPSAASTPARRPDSRIGPPPSSMVQPTATVHRRHQPVRHLSVVAADTRASAVPEPARPPVLDVSEVTLLERARQSVRTGEPEAALTQIREHEARFPTGVLVEEREALAVEALVRAGRLNEARPRFQRLLRAYPRSSYRVRIAALLDGKGGP